MIREDSLSYLCSKYWSIKDLSLLENETIAAHSEHHSGKRHE